MLNRKPAPQQDTPQDEPPAAIVYVLPSLRLDTPLLFSLAVAALVTLGGSLLSWRMNGAPAVRLMLALGILVGFGFRQRVSITEEGVRIALGLRKIALPYALNSLHIGKITGFSCMLATLRPSGYCLYATNASGRITKVPMLLSLADAEKAQALIDARMLEKQKKERVQWRELHAMGTATK